MYRWKGSVEETTEVLCVLKAPAGSLDALVRFVKERHPYDTPEITVLESSFTDERYLSWAEAETREARGAAGPRASGREGEAS